MCAKRHKEMVILKSILVLLIAFCDQNCLTKKKTVVTYVIFSNCNYFLISVESRLRPQIQNWKRCPKISVFNTNIKIPHLYK